MTFQRQEFSENLRRLRKARDLTQEELSLQSGYDRTYIGKIERGSKDPSFSAILRISDTLGVSVQELFKPPVVSGKNRAPASGTDQPASESPESPADLYRLVFQNSDHMIVVTDPDGIILEINSAALNFCGHSVEQVLGLPLSQVRIWHTDGQDRSRFQRALREARRGTHYHDTIQVSENGTRKTVTLSVKPILSDNATVQFLMVEAFLHPSPPD